jgi:hypothetical protein
MKRILFSPEGSGGGGAGENPPALQDTPAPTPPTPPNPPVPPTAPVPAPPPAATTVLDGTKSERELQLEQELATAAEAKKNLEIRNSQLEDENHLLKRVPTHKPGRAGLFKVK